MRPLIVAVISAALAQAASAQPSMVKADPLAEPNAQMNAEMEVLMKLHEFAKKLEDAGFKEIQILPQAVLVRAKNKSDKPVMMLVDTDTMVGIQLQTTPQSEATGSGSPDSGKNRLKAKR
jgi:hypothetical protein